MWRIGTARRFFVTNIYKSFCHVGSSYWLAPSFAHLRLGLLQGRLRTFNFALRILGAELGEMERQLPAVAALLLADKPFPSLFVLLRRLEYSVRICR